MKYFKPFLIILATITFLSHASYGQAWVQAKGDSYSQLAFSFVTGDSKYNKDGNPLDLVRKVSDNTIQLYHEHGVSNRLTIVGNVPIKFVSTGDNIVSSGFSGKMLPAGRLSGLGNLSLSAIYGLNQDAQWVYSIQLKTDVNTASEDQPTGLRTGVDAYGIAPSFHIGHGATSFWTAFDIGMNFRTNDYSTQWFSNFQIGSKFGQSFILIGQFGALQSFEDGDALDGNAIETGLYTNNLEFAAYSLKLGYEFYNNITILGTIGGGVSGNDVTRAPAFTLAVSYKRMKKSR